MLQKMNDPQYSVMIVMAIYANVAFKRSPLSHTDKVMMLIIMYIFLICIYYLFVTEINHKNCKTPDIFK